MSSSTQPSTDSGDTASTWHTVRYGFWPLSLFIYLASLPVLAANIIVSLRVILSYRGDNGAWIVLGGCVVMIVLTPLMALLIRRLMYWQVSTVGLRHTSWVFQNTLTWDEIECVRRFWLFPIFFVGGLKREFIPKHITVAPWIMERYPEFQRLIIKCAPSGHVLVEFASRGVIAE